VAEPTDLPALDAAQTAHCERVVARVREAIAAAGGWIDFARYMEMVLYEPGLGYYSAGAHKLGVEGDFITAPEVAPVFSRCIAAQCRDVLAELPGGDVLELGAGSGAMAAVILAELQRVDRLPQRYFILDVSADLRERQRATLAGTVPHLLERVQWLDTLPACFEGVILANEVLDALPVQRFVVRAEAVNALGVTWQLGQLELAETRAAPQLHARVRALEQELDTSFASGYCSEWHPTLGPWIAALGQTLARGALLLIDYGLPRRELYAPERSTGTLLCHFRHRFHDDALARPGLQDITAWVDFTAVAEAGVAAGLELAGYTTQAQFLIGCGIEHWLRDVADLDTVQRVNLSRQVMLLTLPGEMGERFKAIAFTRGLDSSLRGFSARDLSHQL
jgi:SAM-dependent MidA family methyltransferase